MFFIDAGATAEKGWSFFKLAMLNQGWIWQEIDTSFMMGQRTSPATRTRTADKYWREGGQK